MKILKILIIFVVLVGAIFLIAQWDKIFHNKTTEPTGAPLSVTEECEKVRAEWEKEKNWNLDLFEKQRSRLEQNKRMNRFKRASNAETVQGTIREQATKKLYDAIFREFHSATCDDKLVELNYAGVTTLITAYDMDGDATLKKVRNVKKVYDDITKFIRSPHTIVAKYDASSNSWTSFSALSQSIINTAANYRNNTIYKEELSDIKRFIDGLNDSHIRSVVNGQENAFYRSLSNQIINHFASADVTEPNLARFNNATDKYGRETTRYSSEVLRAYRDFKKKYDEQAKE